MATYEQWVEDGRPCFGCGATGFKAREDFVMHANSCSPVQVAIAEGKAEVLAKFESWKHEKQIAGTE